MIAIVVGHTKKKPGASNKKLGIDEFNVNNEVANLVKTLLADDVNINIIYRDTYNKLPTKINNVGPEYIISLHCNASMSGKASGTETLYCKGSTKGKLLAYDFQRAMIKALGLRDRGIKPVGKTGRGYHLLSKTKAPCIILEPFFIDNTSDVKTFYTNYSKYVGALVETIKRL